MRDPHDHPPGLPTAGSPVVGVVLAAGAGTRFGAPKIAAQQGNWLRIAVHALALGGCDEVLVTMGAQVVEPPAGARAIIVDDWHRGLSRSVAAGLIEARRSVDSAVVVLHVVDTPDVGPDVVARTIGASGHRRDALVRATFDTRPGHPVIIGSDHVDALLAGLTGDAGAGRYLAAHATEVTEVECGDLAAGLDHDHDDGQ